MKTHTHSKTKKLVAPMGKKDRGRKRSTKLQGKPNAPAANKLTTPCHPSPVIGSMKIRDAAISTQAVNNTRISVRIFRKSGLTN